MYGFVRTISWHPNRATLPMSGLLSGHNTTTSPPVFLGIDYIDTETMRDRYVYSPSYLQSTSLICFAPAAIFLNSAKSSRETTSTTSVSLVFTAEQRHRRKHLEGNNANCLVCS